MMTDSAVFDFFCVCGNPVAAVQEPFAPLCFFGTEANLIPTNSNVDVSSLSRESGSIKFASLEGLLGCRLNLKFK